MRLTKDISIIEDNETYKFRLKQVSAYDLHRWGVKVTTALAESGLLKLSGGVIADFNVDKIFSEIAKNGTTFLGNLDPDKANDLIFELVFKTASRLNGSAVVQLDADELQNTFFDVRSLIQLEKEVFAINFQKYFAEMQSDSPISPATENDTSKRGITVKPLHR